MKYYKKNLSGILGVLLVSIMLAGCSAIFTPPDISESNSTISDSLTQRDYLALLKTQDNHKTSIEELQNMASSLLKTNAGMRSVSSPGSAITGTRKLTGFDGKRFAPSASARSVGLVEEEPVEIYELTIGDSSGNDTGFILASNDDRVSNFLAMAEGSLTDTDNPFVKVLNDCLTEYIDSTIAEYDSITDAEIEAAIAKAEAEQLMGARTLSTHWSSISNDWVAYASVSDFTVQTPPLLKTKWGQGSYSSSPNAGAYNAYIKYEHNNTYHIAGCVPVAMAQIVAYHNYINSNAPYKPAPFSSSTIGEWSGTYNFTVLREVPTINNSTLPLWLKGHVGALMWQLGKVTYASYDFLSTGVTPINAKYAFETLGYTIDGGNLKNATTLTETSTSSTIYYLTSPTYVKNALNNNRPIYTRGNSSNGGHAWVTDGYGTMTYYREYVYNTQTGQTGYVTITLSNCLMVHCNLGWDGNSNGWYVYGLFDTANRAVLEGYNSNDLNGGNFSTNIQLMVPIKP
jgi:hypothetical protein